MRSEEELREASGYAGRPRDFDDVIRVLDQELHLITPSDPEVSPAQGQTARPGGPRYYQLTHDYLVHSLREWLIPKRRETRQGRRPTAASGTGCALERQAGESPSADHLGMGEHPDLDASQRLDRAAATSDEAHGRVHGPRVAGVAASVFALLTWGTIEAYGNFRASALVESLRTATISDVPAIVGRISSYRRWADSRLRVHCFRAPTTPAVKNSTRGWAYSLSIALSFSFSRRDCSMHPRPNSRYCETPWGTIARS